MLCPNCKNELIVVEREKIELDYCTECNGFWFDNHEWDLLVERLALRGNKPVGDLYTIPKVFVNEGLKKCPCSPCISKHRDLPVHPILTICFSLLSPPVS